MAAFQLVLALLLVVRPGPRVYRAGVWGSGVIALAYVVLVGLNLVIAARLVERGRVSCRARRAGLLALLLLAANLAWLQTRAQRPTRC